MGLALELGRVLAVEDNKSMDAGWPKVSARRNRESFEQHASSPKIRSLSKEPCPIQLYRLQYLPAFIWKSVAERLSH